MQRAKAIYAFARCIFVGPNRSLFVEKHLINETELMELLLD